MRLLLNLAVLGFTVGATSLATAQPFELRPNLQALPAHDVSVELDVVQRPTLRFAVTTWNSGDGAAEVVAGETGTNRKGQNRQNVYQTIQLDDGGSYQRLAGSFIWHPDHHHFHMNDYAIYSLQAEGAKGKSKRTSAKTSFCLMDTTRIDGSLPGSPGSAFYGGCNDVKQGISVGWGDVYGAHLPGQSIDLTDLSDGVYHLTVEVDPKGRLLETNDDDNTSCVVLDISVSSLSVDVVNPNGCTGTPEPPSVVTVTAMTPSSGSKGSMVPVSILGTGFASGMSVSFENGSGPKPAISDVTVVDSTTINALVTVKKGGSAGTVWDLRVGSGVLIEAFTITP